MKATKLWYLPPNYCDLNAIEYVWASVKTFIKDRNVKGDLSSEHMMDKITKPNSNHAQAARTSLAIFISRFRKRSPSSVHDVCKGKSKKKPRNLHAKLWFTFICVCNFFMLSFFCCIIILIQVLSASGSQNTVSTFYFEKRW